MERTESIRRWLLVISAMLIAIAYLKAYPQALQFNLVDARVYGVAIEQWMNGKDPYTFTTEMNLLYPPVFVYVGAALGHLLTPHVGWLLYLAIHFVSCLCLPWILHRHYLLSDSMGIAGFYVLFFAAPGFLGLEAFETGNIAVICYTGMLLAGARGLRDNNWGLFYLAVFCCCSIKITFIPMLLLPLLCGGRQLVNSFLCASTSVTGLLAQRWFVPSLYARFVDNLHREAMQMGDVGKGLFGITFHFIHKFGLPGIVIVPALIYIVSAIAVVSLLMVLKARKEKEGVPTWHSLVLVGLLFTIPRLNYYDLCVAFPLSFFFFIEATKIRQPVVLFLLVSIPSVFVLRRDNNSAFNGGVEGLAILAMWSWTCYCYVARLPESKNESIDQLRGL